VTERTKGGLMVDGASPPSCRDRNWTFGRRRDLDSLVGQDIPVKVIKLNWRRGNVGCRASWR
jgi:hypothetical protein